MRKLLFSTCSAFVILCAPVQANTLIQIVVDTSGVMHDERDPEQRSSFGEHVDSFLRKLARDRRRDRDETTIRIISGVEQNYVVWSGTASDFYREGLESAPVRELTTEAPQGCNDLISALDELAVGRQIASASENIVHLITSGVHSGPDCSSLTQEAYAELVVSTDAHLITRIGEVSQDFDAFSISFLTAPQRRAFFAGLKDTASHVELFAQGEEPRR